jgi:hypothetical protein
LMRKHKRKSKMKRLSPKVKLMSKEDSSSLRLL